MTSTDGKRPEGARQPVVRPSGMRLIPLEASDPTSSSSTGTHWVNPEHLVALTQLRARTGQQVMLSAEVKLVGMPLMRVRLGAYDSDAAADDAWTAFLARWS